jgi:transposase-like protein
MISKFNAETRAVVLDKVGAGASIPEAARAAGVGTDTLKRWLTRGRREDIGPFSDFEAAVVEAREAVRQAPAPMSPEEFRQHLDRSVRAGSVQAMKLWADRFLVADDPVVEQPVSAITRLAQRPA